MGEAHDYHDYHDHHDHHDHHHDHAPSHKEACAIGGAQVSLEAHTHEQAATVSLDIRPAAGSGFAFQKLVSAMRALASEAEALGGIVGHIKAFAREGDAFAHASVTAADLPPESEGDIGAAFGSNATIQLVAIVLLVDQDALVEVCKTTLQQAETGFANCLFEPDERG